MSGRFLKRALDLAGASFGLVVLSPVLALTTAALRFSVGSPVFFRHQRPGLNGRPFTLVKFRTMTDARDAQGKLLPDSERLTRVGRWVRAASLDEFPQLWNVLKGDMSLVGPRPLLTQYLERYSAEQARRHQMRPGMTGWVAVNGRNALSPQGPEAGGRGRLSPAAVGFAANHHGVCCRRMKTDFCEYCSAAMKTGERLVTVHRHSKGRHFIFEQVQARVCPRCGERYFSVSVVRKMDQQMKRRISPAHTIPVCVISLRPAG